MMSAHISWDGQPFERANSPDHAPKRAVIIFFTRSLRFTAESLACPSIVLLVVGVSVQTLVTLDGSQLWVARRGEPGGGKDYDKNIMRFYYRK